MSEAVNDVPSAIATIKHRCHARFHRSVILPGLACRPKAHTVRGGLSSGCKPVGGRRLIRLN